MASSTQSSSLWHKHAIFEKNSIILLLGIVVMIAIGGLVEIVPLFYLKSTIEKVDGVRPYSPLELAGYNIYVREGCYNCHSQMIRPLRDEVERYGHYSLAAESMYDHPFQWGSKRNGPDLARVGGKYSDDWHRDHMRNPRAVVPASIMPGYPWLEKTALDSEHIAQQMRVLSIVGVPYTQEMIDNAGADLKAQGSGEGKAATAMQKRYPNAIARDLGADKASLTELDAMIAYLQRLGTQVDFKLYDNKANIR
jgi:cytochrome c oxidase cbb3-type subunit II